MFFAIEGTPKFLLKSVRRDDADSPFVENIAAFSSLTADSIVYPVWLSTDRCTLWVVTKATNSSPGILQSFDRPSN